jgi:hypothetical protein
LTRQERPQPIGKGEEQGRSPLGLPPQPVGQVPTREALKPKRFQVKPEGREEGPLNRGKGQIMGNIVKFPKRPEGPQPAELDADSLKAAIRSPRPTLPGVLAWLWRLLRLPLFLVLYWLRLPIVGLCNLVSVPALLAFLAGFFFIGSDSPHRHIVWVFGGVSFTAAALAWFYDSLLLALAPEGVVIGL